jgi:hypothetical protein
MKKKAFDLMVAKNCEMFRTVGRYDKRWYLSDLYLKELSDNHYRANLLTMAKSIGFVDLIFT